MKKLKTYTAVIKIGDGSKDLGLYHVKLEVEAYSPKLARDKALKIALSSTDVSVQLSEGRELGDNPVYRDTYGDNPEHW